MNSKSIKNHLKAKLNDWCNTIDDYKVRQVICNNAIITGGAIVSLLTDEPVNDYDVYFQTKDACKIVAEYYVEKWKDIHPGGHYIEVRDDDDCVSVYIGSAGIVTEQEQPMSINLLGLPDEEKPDEKYRPICMTSNAITLSDKIQVVTRFYGNVEEIHKNYDFAHCTCSWSAQNNELILPPKALECILTKELCYIGSKYPLSSLIRTRKYLQRGYNINAGQYVKMAFQLNELNLRDPDVLKDQLIGVDSSYFLQLLGAIQSEHEIDSTHLIELIDQIF